MILENLVAQEEHNSVNDNRKIRNLPIEVCEIRYKKAIYKGFLSNQDKMALIIS